jgi:Glycosyl hydrolases family 2, TIM barrel domain/Glycosyl hydrolases family 2, sugar binding domain/Glycosyl hydrolases family 2
MRRSMVKYALVLAALAGGVLAAVAVGQQSLPPSLPTITVVPGPVPAPGSSGAPQSGTGYTAETPPLKANYRDGPSGRYLLDGTWLWRNDTGNVGIAAHYQDNPGVDGWTKVTIPESWNALDPSSKSFSGGVAWYRKDFRLPSAPTTTTWIARFESVNYEATVWLNGHVIGRNRGAYLPFEFVLPARQLHPGETNRIVVRVDDRRHGYDFPPSGLSVTGSPLGGWWNYGGILRDVYLRAVNQIDLGTPQIRPLLPCSTCNATIAYKVIAHNYSDQTQKVRLNGSYGAQSFSFGAAAIGPGQSLTFTKSITIQHPQLWSPDSPHLYNATLTAFIETQHSKTVTKGKGKKKKKVTTVTVVETKVGSYFFASGIRSIQVAGGHLLLNGRTLNFRGVGMHEDSQAFGFAINNDLMEQDLLQVKALGATAIRVHYPYNPFIQEEADRLGIMIWSEVPVYSIKAKYLKSQLVRKLASKYVSENVAFNQNHPSIIVWSIGNELSSNPGPVQGAYIRRAANSVHKLDPTRPVGLAVAVGASPRCQTEYKPLDLLGLNEYFGWYPGEQGQAADQSLLADSLDAIHQCYPDKAMVITETGVEANRNGPVEEHGTYQFQEAFVKYHFGLFAQLPWLSGAMYWALKDFRVRPGWTGGNPRPVPPLFEKGLITLDNLQYKPAFGDLKAIFTATKQIGSVVPGK